MLQVQQSEAASSPHLASTVPRPHIPLNFRNLVVLPVFLLSLILPWFGSRTALAQAVPTASRRYGVSAFFAGGTGNTDYGQTDSAYIAGVDLEFFPRWAHAFRPSLEARVTFMPGSDIGEKTFGGGLLVERPLGRFHPYGEFEVGHGIISLPVLHDPNYTSDNSNNYNFGGGLLYDVVGPFAVKVDYQEQSWKLGNANSRLTPTLFTVGVQYTLTSRAFRSER